MQRRLARHLHQSFLHDKCQLWRFADLCGRGCWVLFGRDSGLYQYSRLHVIRCGLQLQWRSSRHVHESVVQHERQLRGLANLRRFSCRILFGTNRDLLYNFGL